MHCLEDTEGSKDHATINFERPYFSIYCRGIQYYSKFSYIQNAHTARKTKVHQLERLSRCSIIYIKSIACTFTTENLIFSALSTFIKIVHSLRFHDHQTP